MKRVPRGLPEQYQHIQTYPHQRAWIYGEHWQKGDGRQPHERKAYGWPLHAHRVVRVCKKCHQPYRVQREWIPGDWQKVSKKGNKGKQQVQSERVAAHWEEITHPRLCYVCAALKGK